jgi:hypothetical protein
MRIRAAWTGFSCVALLCAVGCARTGPAPTGIAYLDATDGPQGNTRLATGEQFDADTSEPTVGNDNLWAKRPKGIGGTVFTTNDGQPSGPEDGPGLVTTLGGLKPGERYEAYAYFWSDHDDWQLRASLTQISPPGDDPAVGFSKLGSQLSKRAAAAESDDFDGPVITAEENRQLYRADLGETTADADGEIKVWIDDLANAGHTNRTWYDGVGVQELSGQRPLINQEGLLVLGALFAVAAAFVYAIVSLLRDRRRAPEAA